MAVQTNDNKTYYCEKCNRTLGANEFYKSNNLEKYPNEGKFPRCKKCMTMHVNNWDPSTYLWILQEADVPYIPDEWNKLMATYAKDSSKMTGMTIIGRYLGKMQLKQYKQYRWKDTEFLQELANSKIEQTMQRQGYDVQQIAAAVQRASFEMPQGDLTPPADTEDDLSEISPFLASGDEDYFGDQLGGDSAPELDLTPEDIVYLRLKWGKSYKPEEWVRLEQLFEEMMSSYDIQAAGHIDTLKLVCKTSLKANQLLDIGDVDGAQKMVKVYDGLMKSGKFTAAQNKAESGEYVDSISELVAICETEGFIPRFYTDGPQDKVDRTLQDLQSYTRTLVVEEMNLGNLIENAVKQIELDKIKEAEEASEAADEDEIMENSLFSEDAAEYLDDEAFSAFRETEEIWEEEDLEFLKSLTEED